MSGDVYLVTCTRYLCCNVMYYKNVKLISKMCVRTCTHTHTHTHTPVSYTHLDVYKRQERNNIRKIIQYTSKITLEQE